MTTYKIEIEADLHPNRNPRNQGDTKRSLRNGIVAILQEHGVQEADIEIAEAGEEAVQLTEYSTNRVATEGTDS